jgi:hypothetical protein
MAILGSIGKSVYNAATSRMGAAAIIGGAGAYGMYQQTARPAMDAAMDVALGDPNADEYFVGEKLSPLIFGGGIIGRSSKCSQISVPTILSRLCSSS